MYFLALPECGFGAGLALGDFIGFVPWLVMVLFGAFGTLALRATLRSKPITLPGYWKFVLL